MERPEEGMKVFAVVIRDFYRCLVEGGVPEQVALDLTRELLIQMFDKSYKSALFGHVKDDS